MNNGFMNINWLRKKLKRRFGAPKDIGAVPQAEYAMESLDSLGYPDVYIVDFYLSASVADQRDGYFRLIYPTICCACGQPQKNVGDMAYRFGLFRKEIVYELPFCHIHMPGSNTPFIMKIIRVTPLVVKTVVVSKSMGFILELRQLNGAVAPPLPWDAFVALDPESSGWRQGEAEAWWHSQWRPYWEGISRRQQEQILCARETPQAWKESLGR